MSFFKSYFHIPSSEGFSPYKPGQSIHIFTSGLIAIAVLLFFGSSFEIKVSIIFAAILLFWGIGVKIGTHSRYSGFTILAIILPCSLIAYQKPQYFFEGMVLGFLVHGFVKTILSLFTSKEEVPPKE